MEARRYSRKHMILYINRVAIEHILIPHDRECPRLLVYCVRRVHGGVD